jgi:magnesium transporter
MCQFYCEHGGDVKATRLLSHSFLQAHPEDAARVLERLPAKEQARLIADVPVGTRRVMEHMTPVMSAKCLTSMNAGNAARVIKELSLDYKLAVLRCMQGGERERLFQTLGATEAEPLRTLLRYPNDTAGALMDPYVSTFPDDITVGEALRRAKSAARGLLYYLYVTDREQTLVGVATLRELMHARASDALSSVMRREVASLSATTRSDDIVKNPHWRDFHALPVVDERGRFLGVIRHETLRRVEHEVVQDSQEGGAIDTLLALGELYWIGLASIMPGVTPEVDRHHEEDNELENHYGKQSRPRGHTAD